MSFFFLSINILPSSFLMCQRVTNIYLRTMALFLIWHVKGNLEAVGIMCSSWLTFYHSYLMLLHVGNFPPIGPIIWCSCLEISFICLKRYSVFFLCQQIRWWRRSPIQGNRMAKALLGVQTRKWVCNRRIQVLTLILTLQTDCIPIKYFSLDIII